MDAHKHQTVHCTSRQSPADCSRRRYCQAGELQPVVWRGTATALFEYRLFDLWLQRPTRGPKRRLDEACLEQLPSTARNVVQSWIIQGKVVVNGKVVTKPGTPVSPQAKIDILAVEQQYVCRYSMI